jgi:hypothetical protein
MFIVGVGLFESSMMCSAVLCNKRHSLERRFGFEL